MGLWTPNSSATNFLAQVAAVDVTSNDYVVALLPPSCYNDFYTESLTRLLKTTSIQDKFRLDPSFPTAIPFDFNNPSQRSACLVFVVPTSDKNIFPDQQATNAAFGINPPMVDLALRSWPKGKEADTYVYKYCYKLGDKNIKKAFGSFFDDL